VVGGLLTGLLTVRSSGPVVRAAGRVAALAAVSAVGLVAAAVLGDGYFEIAKHVWLAAYFLAVTVGAVLLAVVAIASRAFAVIEARLRRDRRAMVG
jgi:hypothetical protein